MNIIFLSAIILQCMLSCDASQNTKMAAPNSLVGFECEFVEAPPEWLQTECPICLHILQEPHQVTCCGKSFCRQCIERVKAEHKPCPCCNKDKFNDFPNKGLQQPLYGFKVYCTNKGKHCEWKGELGDLEKHLNQNLQDEKELEGCEFAEIKCSYCSDVIVRSKLLHHKIELCDKRPFSCEYCNEYESTYDDVIHNHWPVCGCYPIRCPNECGSFPQRQNVDGHIQKDCPLAVVECDFHYVGCEVRLPRGNMPDHLKDGLVVHFSLLAVSHKQQQEEIKAMKWKHQEEIKALERRHQEEIKALNEEMSKLKLQTNQLRLHTQIVPLDFTVENPHIGWSSTPFYSHSQGYKLHLRFYKNDISCHLMQGEFDKYLKWPLNAVMKITLFQQLHGVDCELNTCIHLSHKTCLSVLCDTDICGSVLLAIDLSPYLSNNCLQMKIVSLQFLE